MAKVVAGMFIDELIGSASEMFKSIDAVTRACTSRR
jgi:hypothetical protein